MSRPLDEHDVPQFSKRALGRAIAQAAAAERQRIRQQLGSDEFSAQLLGILDEDDAMDAVQFFIDLLEPQPVGADAEPGDLYGPEGDHDRP